jgi:signal transduction histidine kinase
MVAMADHNMLNTILRNLTSNAIKFTTPGGTVDFSTSVEDDMVNLTVKDSGVGIPEEKMKTLFSLEKGKSTTGTVGETGTGLGLLVCNEFLDLNKGSIKVESIPGKGSSFTISLPSQK